MAVKTLSTRALNRALLARQLLLERKARPLSRVLDRLVGLQAQQVSPPFVGLWTRSASASREQLAEAIRTRKVVKVTAMRATLHLMRAEDFLALRSSLQPVMSSAARSVLKSRLDAIDLPELCAAARNLVEAEPMPFTPLREALSARFPDADARAMGYAVRTHLPLIQLPAEGGLLPWAHAPNSPVTTASAWLDASPDPSDQVETLVRRYLAGFGPASPADAQSWSGRTGLRPVFEAMELRRFRDPEGRELFDLPRATRPDPAVEAPLRYIPGFDNLVLGHAHRSRIVGDDHRKLLVTKNLLVRATFLIDGFVAGTWKVVHKGKRARLEVEAFADRKLSKADKVALADEGARLLEFLAPGCNHDFELV